MSPRSRATIAGSVSELQEIVVAYQEAGVDELIVPDFTLGPDVNDKKIETLDKFISEVAAPVR